MFQRFRRWWNARRIRRRLQRSPIFEDFLDVRDRKSAHLAIYMQERNAGDRGMAAYHRQLHFSGRAA